MRWARRFPDACPEDARSARKKLAPQWRGKSAIGVSRRPAHAARYDPVPGKGPLGLPGHGEESHGLRQV